MYHPGKVSNALQLTMLLLTTLTACLERPETISCGEELGCPTGYECHDGTCIQPGACGNGKQDNLEECDDGGTKNGDGCSETCRREVCGNDFIDPGEECDDGNTSSGDECSSTCHDEVCGNDFIDPGEECDDGDTDSGDGCSSCQLDARLASVVVSGIAPPITLEPGTTEYVINLPLLQQSVTLTASVAEAGDTLVIAGTRVGSGVPSAPIPLSLGDNDVEIVVDRFGWSRTYRLNLRRADLLAQYAYGKASNPGDLHYFGHSVALAGDTLAVGAPTEDSASQGVNGDQTDNSAWASGAVYVFRRTGTAWQQEAYIKASNTGDGDWFGYRVALAGDTLAVGAYEEASAAQGVNGDQADNSAEGSGAVYVFRRTGTSWHQEAYLKASNTDAYDNFGHSVALTSDTLAVGAPYEDSGSHGVNGDQADDTAPASGAVYVFRRTGTSWQQEAYIKASNNDAGDCFGWSVALAGDTLAVGAYEEASAAQGVNGDQADNSAENSGAVYVFRRTGTSWQQEAYIKASNTGAKDYFGYSVALSGDTLAVGAYCEDSASTGINGDQADDSTFQSGAAYVFRRAGTSWQQEAYIKASNTDAIDWFGMSVALAGDTLAVGAPGEDSTSKGINGIADNDSEKSGAVYMFRRTGTSWQQEAYVKASNTGIEDQFGESVALADDSLAVGSIWEDGQSQGVNGNQNDNGLYASGAVYIFH